MVTPTILEFRFARAINRAYNISCFGQSVRNTLPMDTRQLFKCNYFKKNQIGLLSTCINGSHDCIRYILGSHKNELQNSLLLSFYLS